MNAKRPKRQRLAFFPLKQSRENRNIPKHQHKTARLKDIKKNETLVQLSDIPAQIFHENFCVIFTSPNSSVCETLMPWNSTVSNAPGSFPLERGETTPPSSVETVETMPNCQRKPTSQLLKGQGKNVKIVP